MATRELSIVAGIAHLNGVVRIVTSSRTDDVQGVTAVFPNAEFGEVSSDYRLFYLGKPSTKIEVLEFLAAKYPNDGAERAYIVAALDRAKRAEAPKAANPGGKRGKAKINYFANAPKPVEVEAVAQSPEPVTQASKKRPARKDETVAA